MIEQVKNKICITCGIDKDISEYYYCKTNVKGKDYWNYKGECKKCVIKRYGKRALKRTEDGLCRRCDNKVVEGHAYCQDHINDFAKRGKEKNLKNKDKISLQNKRSVLKIKKEIMNAYGNKCECCGETNLKFLAIDHIDGKGKEHREAIGGKNIYYWLRKNNFPKDNFRLLCHNCNMSRGMFGYCPHEKNIEDIRDKKIKHKKRYIKLRVIDGYGGKCEFCGEDNWEFLCIDHIKNNGKEDRIKFKNNRCFYIWLYKNNFPKDDYRLLCHNCNMSKSFFSDDIYNELEVAI